MLGSWTRERDRESLLRQYWLGPSFSGLADCSCEERMGPGAKSGEDLQLDPHDVDRTDFLCDLSGAPTLVSNKGTARLRGTAASFTALQQKHTTRT